jgi:hypothetical protein
MANQKISQLTEQTDLSLIDGLAGYQGTSNVKISGPNIISAIPTLYTNDGTLSEDRVITVDHDATTKASYTTTFESNKTTNTTTRNTAFGTRLILTETVTSAPTGYSTSRGAGVNLTHNSSGDDVTGTVNVQSINSGSSDYYGRSQMGFRTNTGFVFSQQGTAPSGWGGDALIVRDRLASNQSKSLRYHPSQSDGGRLRLCAPNAKTSQILFATNISNTFYRYISGKNTGALTLGRKLTSGNEEAYITCNGIGGSASADIAVGINQDTPTATLHVTGSGAGSATTSLLVENSLGDEIIKVRDDKTIRLGFNGNQITTTASFGGQVNLNDTNGNSLFRVDTVSGSTGKITVSQGGWRSFEYAANQGLALTDRSGFHIAQDASSMFTCNSIDRGMLPPRMTTTQRDAINSGTFTTGLTLYNTTTNKLQFYDGTAWTDAGGGGDSIYTADGTLSGSRTITVPSNANVTFSYTSTGYFYIGSNSISSNGIFRAPIGGRFEINSYSTRLAANYVQFYGSAYITGTTAGFVTVGASTGTAYSINARLGVVGKSATSTTDYAFRVQDSASADMFSLRDDGAFALGKGATNSSSSNVAIGDSVTTSSVSGVAIGRQASISAPASYSTVIGNQAATTFAQNVAIGAYSAAGFKGTNVGYGSSGTGNYAINLGHDADGSAARAVTINASSGTAAPSTEFEFGVYMTGASTPDFKVVGNEGMVPPSITTTVRDAIADPSEGSTIYNTTDNKLQYYDGTDWQSPTSEPYLDVFDTSPASPDPLSIYNDGIIQIWLDESNSDDVEVQVLTDPAESADVNFTWWSPTAGTDGSVNINAADGRTQLNAEFNNNDVHQMNVFAPTDTSFPYYEVRITKTDTGFTGVPAIIRVSKYTI